MHNLCAMASGLARDVWLWRTCVGPQAFCFLLSLEKALMSTMVNKQSDDADWTSGPATATPAALFAVHAGVQEGTLS